MGSPVEHVKNEIDRLIAEYELNDSEQEQLGSYVQAKYNLKTWESAIRTLRKQLDTAVSYLTVDQYVAFTQQIKSVEFSQE